MLQLKNIRKTYHVGSIETKALDDVSVSFGEKEFVAILGTSGSGKTTALNIIGGLDRYDSGELIIKGKKTSDFKEKDWDAYRNNTVGFVFQSYNLIMHLSIVNNVELGMTLSGVSSKEKHERAIKVLEQVGLKDHLHKKPNQLSGGQMQRVAIARALANDPEILLCDEPTGALDTATSIQIMDLIKEVAKDRLVIMVTHNPDIAEQYADRIIRFQDGKIIADSKPYNEEDAADKFNLKKTSMSFFTALKLSFNNIRTKKGRTFLTAFASSIGIIGIAVILSLSNGFQEQINDFQSGAMAEFPIIISKSAVNMNPETMATMRDEMKKDMAGTEEYAKSDKVFLYDPKENNILHNNDFTDEYMDYINKISPTICKSIGYTRIVNMNLLRKTGDDIKPISFSADQTTGNKMQQSTNITSMNNAGLSSYPKELKEGSQSYLEKNYELLSGAYPKDATDLVLVIDSKNRIDYNILNQLGFETDDVKSIDFNELVGTTFKIIANDDYYKKTQFGSYMPGDDYKAMYNSDKSIEVKIAGIVRQKEGTKVGILGNGIAYSDELSQKVINLNASSDIVKAQKDSEDNVLSMQKMSEDDKKNLLAYLGGDSTPYMMMIYPNNFSDKDAIIKYLDDYNTGKKAEDQIVYTDLAETISSMTSSIMDGITIVLIAFAAISLIVSLIMICIITYTSVLERTKEIGILRALGARKKDITRVFDAETTILGVFSGILGVVIAYLLTIPINALLYNLTELENVSSLRIEHAIFLVLISTVLTILGGHIPARMASRKDAVEALRSE